MPVSQVLHEVSQVLAISNANSKSHIKSTSAHLPLIELEEVGIKLSQPQYLGIIDYLEVELGIQSTEINLGQECISSGKAWPIFGQSI